ncbi:hypothetical protein XH97_30465 [Bradyrhizobium sp. CCBAU 53380]|nr:hypothetical protein [Bradyrhizobium sp. CCBAU 53380]
MREFIQLGDQQFGDVRPLVRRQITAVQKANEVIDVGFGNKSVQLDPLGGSSNLRPILQGDRAARNIFPEEILTSA